MHTHTHTLKYMRGGEGAHKDSPCVQTISLCLVNKPVRFGSACKTRLPYFFTLFFMIAQISTDVISVETCCKCISSMLR